MTNLTFPELVARTAGALFVVFVEVVVAVVAVFSVVILIVSIMIVMVIVVVVLVMVVVWGLCRCLAGLDLGSLLRFDHGRHIL